MRAAPLSGAESLLHSLGLWLPHTLLSLLPYCQSRRKPHSRSFPSAALSSLADKLSAGSAECGASRGRVSYVLGRGSVQRTSQSCHSCTHLYHAWSAWSCDQSGAVQVAVHNPAADLTVAVHNPAADLTSMSVTAVHTEVAEHADNMVLVPATGWSVLRL